jgi:hypothetical protein
MDLRDDGEVSKLPHGDPRLGQIIGAISTLNEAWVHTLDRCVTDAPPIEVIFPLMRNAFLAEQCTRFSCCRTVMATC